MNQKPFNAIFVKRRMNKFRLHLADESPEFRLVGISCHQKDYRAAWAVGQALGIEFMREDSDWQMALNKKPPFVIGNFAYFRVETENQCFSLIANLNENGALLPELHSYDYLLLIWGPQDAEANVELIEAIKSHSLIQFCSFFDPEQLKNWDRLPEMPNTYNY